MRKLTVFFIMKQPDNLRNKIRRDIRQTRRNLSESFQIHAAKALVDQVSTLIKNDKPHSVALYLPNDGELSTLPLINDCWQHKIDVFLPVIHPFAKGHLLFLKYLPTTIMKTNQYGIAEPVLDIRLIGRAKDIDIIFTPLVAFDKTGARLGMGGGFYDRTLTQLEQNNAITRVIGLAHDCQCIEHVPTETWDMPLKQIITPTQHFNFG